MCMKTTDDGIVGYGGLKILRPPPSIFFLGIFKGSQELLRFLNYGLKSGLKKIVLKADLYKLL